MHIVCADVDGTSTMPILDPSLSQSNSNYSDSQSDHKGGSEVSGGSAAVIGLLVPDVKIAAVLREFARK